MNNVKNVLLITTITTLMLSLAGYIAWDRFIPKPPLSYKNNLLDPPFVNTIKFDKEGNVDIWWIHDDLSERTEIYSNGKLLFSGLDRHLTILVNDVPEYIVVSSIMDNQTAQKRVYLK